MKKLLYVLLLLSSVSGFSQNTTKSPADLYNSIRIKGAIPGRYIQDKSITADKLAPNISIGGSGTATTNASQITSGTLPDARLSTNIATISGIQTFTNKNISGANNTFTNIAQSSITGLVTDLNNRVLQSNYDVFVNATNNTLNDKQATLISGSTIKTVNGISLLGTGDIVISAGGAATTSATSLTAGTLDDARLSTNVTRNSTAQTLTNKSISGASNTFSAVPQSAITNLSIDLAARVTQATYDAYVTSNNTALGTKQATLVSGTNIRTINGQSLLGSTDLIITGGGGTTDASTLTTGILSDSRLSNNIARKIYVDSVDNVTRTQVTTINSSTVTNANVSNASKIAGWGDSMTNMDLFTYTTTPYTSYLMSLSGKPVYNLGIGGETSTQIKDRFIADTAKYSYSHIIWVGRNDMTTAPTNGTTVKVNIATMIAAMGHTRYLVIGVLNKNDELNGNTTRNAIITLNSELATLYGAKFLDLRAYLMTQGSGTGQDATDVSNGVIPSGLRFDGTHLNSLGGQRTANLIHSNIAQLENTTISSAFLRGKNSTATSPIGLPFFDVARLGKYSIGGSQVMFLPDQALYTGSIAFGTGGKNLNRTTGSEGFGNVTIGIQTGEAITTGFNNIGVGRFALNITNTGQDNIGIGTGALSLNTAAHKNIAIGTSSLAANTGINSVAVGYNASLLQTTGNNNVSVGLQAMRSNLTGFQNVAVGANAYFLGTGTGHTAVGYQTMFNIGSGSFNTAFGNSALTGVSGNSNISNNTSVGYRSLFGVLTGADNNVAIGYQAGDNLTTGAKNIIIGHDIDAPSATISNQLNIGNIIFGSGVSGTGTTIAGNIGIGVNSPNTKSILDLTSVTQGFLTPRMTTTQRDAITSVPEGLEIYNLTTHAKEFYNGTAWKTVITN